MKPRDSNILWVLLSLANALANSYSHSPTLYPLKFLHNLCFYVAEMAKHYLMRVKSQDNTKETYIVRDIITAFAVNHCKIRYEISEVDNVYIINNLKIIHTHTHSY